MHIQYGSFPTIGTMDIRTLMKTGFSRKEAERLLYMRMHLADEGEYRELLEEARRLTFVRWLIEHGRLNEQVL